MRHHVTAVTQRGVFKLQIRAEIYFLFSSCCEQREEMSSYLYHVQFNVQPFVIKKTFSMIVWYHNLKIKDLTQTGTTTDSNLY